MGELVAEISPLIRARTLRDIQALPPRDLLLIFEPAAQGDPTLRLRLSADPHAPRLHIQHARVPGHGGPQGPFYRLLEEDLKGATLASLTQVRGDRLVILEFRDTSAGSRRALLAELTGRGANLMLLGPGDRLEATLAPLTRPGSGSKEVARGRVLRIGDPWTPPSGGTPPGDTPSLSEALPLPEADAPGAGPAGPADPLPAPLSWRVECALGAQAADSHREKQRAATRRRLERRLARTASRLGGLERRATAAEGAERIRRDGDLLQANLHLLRRGLEQIEVEDLYEVDAPARVIPLDPSLSPQQNIERLYKRHRKLARDGRTLGEQKTRLDELTADLEALLARLADEATDPEVLDREAVGAGLLEAVQVADPRKRPAPRPRLPYKKFIGCAGSEIRVGRSARDNDALTLHHCRGNDLWLHTADVPGSHVVLRGAKGRDADPEEILDAAHLAVHFSPLKDARKVDVHLAHRKHVHKPRGAKAGLVTLSGGKVLRVRVQPERLRRLLRGN